MAITGTQFSSFSIFSWMIFPQSNNSGHRRSKIPGWYTRLSIWLTEVFLPANDSRLLKRQITGHYGRLPGKVNFLGASHLLSHTYLSNVYSDSLSSGSLPPFPIICSLVTVFLLVQQHIILHHCSQLCCPWWPLFLLGQQYQYPLCLGSGSLCLTLLGGLHRRHTLAPDYITLEGYSSFHYELLPVPC